MPTGTPSDTFARVFAIFLRLGLTSFGGPVAHIGFFRDEFVTRRRWLDDRAYGDLVALCQFLPGPASSQVGLAIGMIRSGYAGALAAWLGFTLPSALIMAACGYGLLTHGNVVPPALLHGLKLAALAVVANALYGMARNLCPDRIHAGFALTAAVAMLLADSTWLQVAVIAAAALGGGLFLNGSAAESSDSTTGPRIGRRAAILAAAIFLLALVALPLLVAAAGDHGLVAIFDAFFRVGSLVFGGGHVVLPLLQAELVPTGWIDDNTFIAGYGVAQAVPGPMFTFAAYLGAVATPATGHALGLAGAVTALVAVFLPSFLILIAVLPFWSAIRHMSAVRSVFAGVNAGVVGLLLAALYDPVWTSSVHSAIDLALALAALFALAVLRLPSWAVVVAMAAITVAAGQL